MDELILTRNRLIGYDGLKLIGQALPGKHLSTLDLYTATLYHRYPDETCEDAVTQASKRNHAVLEGIRRNVYLTSMDLGGQLFQPQVMSQFNLNVRANKQCQWLLLRQHCLGLKFWPNSN